MKKKNDIKHLLVLCFLIFLMGTSSFFTDYYNNIYLDYLFSIVFGFLMATFYIVAHRHGIKKGKEIKENEQ